MSGNNENFHENNHENKEMSPKTAENRVITENTGEKGAGGKKDNPFSVYAVVSQIGFMVIIPLLVFIWGGSWAVERFLLPQWVMVVFIALGIITMISSVGSYLVKLTRRYGKSDAPKVSELHHDTRDHDYYGD